MAKTVVVKMMDEKEINLIEAIRNGIKDYIESCEKLAESNRSYGYVSEAKADSIRSEAAEMVLKIVDAIVENV